jgi:hypothetical protein
MAVMNPFPSVAIVIPLYQAHLSTAEEASLRQCVAILGHYPLILAIPESLSVASLLTEFPSLTVATFPDAHFESIDSYNRLMVSVDFYRRFQRYAYILIYQPDAFVFRDDLPYWCSQGLDYIGAPTIHKEAFDRLPATQKATFAQALSTERIVFNGGLSLRRVAGLIRYLRIFNTFYPAWRGNEDMLFSLEATRLMPMRFFIKLPTWQQALRFAFEKSPAASYELTDHSLPFGCHAWERYDPDFWKPFIKSSL